MFEELEICFKQIDVALTKMNEIYPLIIDNSEISNFIHENQIINQYLINVKNAIINKISIPKFNGCLDKINKIPPSVIPSIRILIYFSKYFNLLLGTLKKISELVHSMNFRWNYFITIRFVNIFIMFSKLAFFYASFPNCTQIMMMYYIYDTSQIDFIKDVDSNIMSQLIHQIFECNQSPTRFISDNLYQLKDNFIEMLAELSNITLNIIEKCHFDNFSIFYTEPSLDSTFPALDYIILMNYPIIHDLFVFIFLSFPDLANSNEELTSSIISESPFIFLTDGIHINILEYFQRQDFLPDINEHITFSNKKAIQFHFRKINYMTALLSEYLNFGQIDINIINENYIKFVSLVTFSIYELKMFLSFEQKAKEVVELINILCEIKDFFMNKEEEIKRFFIYNLATIDLQFLNELTKTINEDSIIYKELRIMFDSLSIVDFENYENGEKYEFLPLIINIGRLLIYYNKFLKNNPGKFIGYIFDHLNTIILHIDFINSDFYSYLKLYSLSTKSKNFVDHAKDGTIPLNQISSLLRLFGEFYFDSSLSNESKTELMNDYNMINVSISKRCQDHLQKRFSFLSPFIKPNNTFLMTFPQISQRAKCIQETSEVLDFYLRLPSINVLIDNSKENTLQYFKSQILKEIQYFAFQDDVPTSTQIKRANTALCEYVWPLFTLLDIPFHRVIFNMRLNESMRAPQSNPLSQIRLLNGTPDNEDLGTSSTANQHIFVKYIKRLEKFFYENEYRNMIYHNNLYGFYPKEGQRSTIQDLFSASAFKTLIDDFGPHFAIQISAILTNQISDSITKIFQNFYQESPTILKFYGNFRNDQKLPSNQEIQSILPLCDEMIKLGSAVAIRRLLRSQIQKSSDIYLPGFSSILANAIRNVNIAFMVGGKHNLLVEAFGGTESYKFAKENLAKKKLIPQSDFIRFCFYLSLLLKNDIFDEVKFNASYESMTNNVHLFPVAMGAIIDCCIGTLFTACDDKIVKEGLHLFFVSFASNVRQRSKTASSETIHALQTLATLFPKYIERLEYGRIEDAFPFLEMSHILIEHASPAPTLK
ncbi:hypothetical protein TRFO_03009 [Tritrichomonas foetus]|uniref:CYRIA/CYRIB Rac1 binding domain-containing protein n=1 Tax=Tritrichomonas foetus TaxID=1144522 RepID=A0A1J4KTY6_9EUKA|nr:hypothetical protein TRFO_03009 [Tritrichomonas foetus]|eukprot:OHT14745.1 hypothetical protein TRFO_03009 [Tritrichomonas foetus]